jgi:hypothetical protein
MGAGPVRRLSPDGGLMRVDAAMLTAVLLLGVLMWGCGGGGNNGGGGGGGNQVAAPTIAATTNAQTGVQGGAEIVSLASTTAGAIVYYTVDGSAPSATSQQYQAPFLVASNLTVKAIAIA